MRRYDIVSGILFILSIIDFALTAPVLVQEEHQARINMVHIPKDVITMLGKRADEIDDFEKLLKSLETPDESSEAHASSSSVSLGPDHASSSSAPPMPDHASSSSKPPGPNPAFSTADPGRLMEPLSPFSEKGVWGDDDRSRNSDAGFGSDGPLFTPTSSHYGSDEDPTWAQQRPPIAEISPHADPNFDWEHWQKKVNEEDHPDSMATHQALDPNFDWEHWQSKVNEEDYSDLMAAHQAFPADPDFNWEHWQKKINQEDHPDWMAAQQELDSYFDRDHWQNKVNQEDHPDLMAAHQPPSYPPLPTDHHANPPSSPTEVYSYPYPPNLRLPAIPEHPVAASSSPGIGSPADTQHEVVEGPPSPDIEPLKEPENEVAKEPPTSPEDDQSSIANSQPVDPQALTSGLSYVLKGKAKASDTTGP